MAKSLDINVHHLTRVEGHGNIVVRASDGKVLLDHASQADIFETLVDADAEYIVAVVAGSVDTDYKLLVRLGK